MQHSKYLWILYSPLQYVLARFSNGLSHSLHLLDFDAITLTFEFQGSQVRKSSTNCQSMHQDPPFTFAYPSCRTHVPSLCKSLTSWANASPLSFFIPSHPCTLPDHANSALVTNPHHPSHSPIPSSTSTSNSSITPNTTPRLSMNPLTATLSIRLVVALYSVRSTVKSSSLLAVPSFSLRLEGPLPLSLISATLVANEAGSLESVVRSDTREKERRTRGESSASTLRARRAELARRWVGRGRVMVLGESVSRFLKSEVGGVLQGAREAWVEWSRIHVPITCSTRKVEVRDDKAESPILGLRRLLNFDWTDLSGRRRISMATVILA